MRPLGRSIPNDSRRRMLTSFVARCPLPQVARPSHGRAPAPTHRDKLTSARDRLGCCRFCRNGMRRIKLDVVDQALVCYPPGRAIERSEISALIVMSGKRPCLIQDCPMFHQATTSLLSAREPRACRPRFSRPFAAPERCSWKKPPLLAARRRYRRDTEHTPCVHDRGLRQRSERRKVSPTDHRKPGRRGAARKLPESRSRSSGDPGKTFRGPAAGLCAPSGLSLGT